MATRLNVVNPALREARNDLIYPPRADFRGDFTSSIIPQQSMGSIAFTRATTATVTDNDGIIRNCLSGEARFKGARRVQNGLPYSQTLTDPSWLTGRSTVTLDTQTINGIPVFRLINDAVMGTHLISKNVSFSFVAGNKYIISCIAKAGTSNYIQLLVATGVSTEYVNFDLSTGTATAGNTTQSSSVSLGNGFYRISLSITAIASGVFGAFYSIINSASASRSGSYSGAGEYILLTATQFEDVTGQSIQTVGDYVSTNVLTTAPFHGSNVDGVKCFNTTLSGTTISPSTLKGYLCEAGKTNLIVQSNNFTVTWAKNAAQLVITAGASVGPDGSLSMTKLSPGAGDALQSMVATATVTAAIYTFSVYAKAGENTFLQLLSQGTVSSGYCNFDLVNGVVGSSSLWTGVIENMGNGIYRCSAITDVLAAVTGGFHVSQVSTLTTGRAGTISGDGVSGLYVYGAQLELGDFPSSYIPTTTAAVARSTDALSYNSSNAIDSQGAAYVEASLILPGNTSSSASSRFLLSRGANGRMFYISSAINNINNYDGTTVLASNLGTSMNGNVVKMASSWSGSTKGIYYGASAPKTSAFDGTMGTGNIDVGLTWNGTIRNVRIWKTPPTDSELQAITIL